MGRFGWVIGGAVLALVVGCVVMAEEKSAPSPQESKLPPMAEVGRQAAEIVGTKGKLNGETYTITIPRDDLDVSIEGVDVPVTAGLEHRFDYFLCPCGKVEVIGQFCVPDYEANDVVDELRKGLIKVVSMGPMFMDERPRLMLVRFQAEGDVVGMSRTLREALRWTGKERMAPTVQKKG